MLPYQLLLSCRTVLVLIIENWFFFYSLVTKCYSSQTEPELFGISLIKFRLPGLRWMAHSSLANALLKLIQCCLLFEICSSLWMLIVQKRDPSSSTCQAMLTHASLPVSRVVRLAGDQLQQGSKTPASCLIHAYVNRTDFDKCLLPKGPSLEEPRLIYMEGDSRMRSFFDCLVSKIAGHHFRSKNS
jgi:hypothetical protein